MNTYFTDKKEEEIAFVILPYFNSSDLDERINEIKELISSCGATCFGHVTQKIREVTPATYIGSGKIEEISDIIANSSVNFIVFDGELSPSQTINLSNALGGIKVIDRTSLILDIFALNAKTSEGKLQVELAQLQYLYPRLKGKGFALSRLGGGIGTRGPGETQLETDRRYIKQRIDKLRSDLNELETRRQLQKTRRDKNESVVISLVGYTNSGKSTLLNLLTGSNVLAENKLFATLDPTMRKFTVGKYETVLVDTVGFIRNIPTNLIEAFKSTLENAVNNDLILNVIDAKSDWQIHQETTLKILRELNATSPIITVFNKCEDITDFSPYPNDAVFISAKYNIGIENLKQKIIASLANNYETIIIKKPYENLGKILALKDFCDSLDITYEENRIVAKITYKKAFSSKFSTI